MNFKGTLILLGILFLVFLVAIIWALVIFSKDSKQRKNSPEYSAQVEVVGKRIWKDATPDTGTSVDYIASFKFPDGSVKELKVGGNSWKIKRELYDSIREGDIGILIYKEREDIEERFNKENRRYNGRQFISFEKDS